MYNRRDKLTVARAARPSRGISLIGRPPATSEHSKNIRRDTQKEAVLRHRGAIWKCLPSVGGHLSPDSISGSLSSPCRFPSPAPLFWRALSLSLSFRRSLPRVLFQPPCSLSLFLSLLHRLTTALNPRGFAHMSTIYFLPAHKSFSG